MFKCDCGCVCGIDENVMKCCECKLLISVSDEHLRQLCDAFGLKSQSAPNRNTLFKLIYNADDPVAVLTHGIRLYVFRESLKSPVVKRKRTISKTLRKSSFKKKNTAKKTRCVDSDG